MDAAELLRQAGRIVQEAGARLEDRNLASQVHAKGPTDFVTAVDTEVQEQIRARLQALDGTIQFMAEEKDNAAIDPSPPGLDPGPGGRHHQPDPRFPAQRNFAGAGRGRQGAPRSCVRPLCGGTVFCPAGRGSVLQRPGHPGQRDCVSGGQPLLGGDQSRPAGGSRRRLCPGPPHLRPLPRHPPARRGLRRAVLYRLRASGCIPGARAQTLGTMRPAG